MEMLTADELAKELKCSAKKLANDRCGGVGPRFVKVGGLVRYPREEINRWLQEQMRSSTSQTSKENG